MVGAVLGGAASCLWYVSTFSVHVMISAQVRVAEIANVPVVAFIFALLDWVFAHVPHV